MPKAVGLDKLEEMIEMGASTREILAAMGTYGNEGEDDDWMASDDEWSDSWDSSDC